MRWVLLWVVLVLAAAGVLGLLGRSLWRKAKALTAELTEASDRMSAVAASISELSAQASGLGDRADDGGYGPQQGDQPRPPAASGARHARRRRG